MIRPGLQPSLCLLHTLPRPALPYNTIVHRPCMLEAGCNHIRSSIAMRCASGSSPSRTANKVKITDVSSRSPGLSFPIAHRDSALLLPRPSPSVSSSLLSQEFSPQGRRASRRLRSYR
jgi:hypothetical protein